MTSLFRFPLSLSVLSLLLCPVISLAQGNSANNSGNKNGDDDSDSRWAGLQAAAKPSPGNSTSAAKGSNEQKTQIAAQAEKSRVTAANARDFYTKFPTHTNAEEARKIEAIAELHGVKDGDAAQEKNAMELGKAFRADRSHSVNARTSVALAMDRLALSGKIKAKSVADRPSEKEKVADGIRAELGHTPELHEYYVEIARAGDMFTAKRIATNLLQWPTAANIRAEAQAIVDRSALVGQKLTLQLPLLEGGTVDLAQTTGGPTVLVAWSPSAGSDMLQSLAPFRNTVPPGVRFVYLALGGTAVDAAAQCARAPLKGLYCQQLKNTVGPVNKALKLKSVPYLYVLNKEGKVAGFGPVGELPGLLSLAMR